MTTATKREELTWDDEGDVRVEHSRSQLDLYFPCGAHYRVSKAKLKKALEKLAEPDRDTAVRLPVGYPVPPASLGRREPGTFGSTDYWLMRPTRTRLEVDEGSESVGEFVFAEVEELVA